MKYLTNVDLLSNELQNAVIQVLAIAPANPKAGQIYTNSTDWHIYQYDGSVWKPVGVVYSQESTTGAVVTGLDKSGNVTTTNVVGLTLTGYSPVSGGYISASMTLQQALAALDAAVQNAVAGGGEVNQNAWSNISVPAQSTNETQEVKAQDATAALAATSKTDTFVVASGDKWVRVRGDADNKKIEVGHAFSGAEAGSYGDGTHLSKVTIDKAGHVVAAESVEIVGAEHIGTLKSDAQKQLDAKIDASEKGSANGVATLGEDGLVPSTQLPSYVDDVVDAYVLSGASAFSAGWLSETDGGAALTPEKGKIYVVVGPAESAELNHQYRWSGTTYVVCNPSDVNSVNGKTGIVSLTQDDVGDGETYTRLSKADKAKLDGVKEGATANTITLNGAETADPTFYAPVSGGSAGQVLTSNGEGAAPTWQAAPENLHKYTITNPELSASGGAFVWTIAAQATGPVAPMLVQVYEATSNAMVMADITVKADNSIVITINDVNAAGSLASGAYKAVAIG